MGVFRALARWLQTHWVLPAYSGGVLIGFTVCFFAAATNTMAGWLYALSGVMSALACLGAWLPPRTLRGVVVQRSPIRPVSVGETVAVEVAIANTTRQAKALIEVYDRLPSGLGPTAKTAIAALGPHSEHIWRYQFPATHRGVFHWQAVTLRTAAPLGLFWCDRGRIVPGDAIVYPEILPLKHCPIIDTLSVATGLRWQTAHTADNASEGLTRALRPYRWGDPTRLIHWRTSARYGELRVRELEQLTADNQVVIALDTRDRWSEADFEAAVSVAASLYVYSLRRQLSVSLWMAHTGLVQNRHSVLSALAAVMPETPGTHRFPSQPVIWLSLAHRLPADIAPTSAWVMWPGGEGAGPRTVAHALAIAPNRPLQAQLEAPLPTEIRALSH